MKRSAAQRAEVAGLNEVEASFGGDFLRPGDPGYDEARRLHNGMIDKHPALIARCLTTADVVAAVDLGRTTGLEIAVRGGGHGIAGRATTDSGLMIDLSLMKGIHVDPVHRTVRAQAGVRVGELDRATRLDIERVRTGSDAEVQVGDRAVAVNQEHHLSATRAASRWLRLKPHFSRRISRMCRMGSRSVAITLSAEPQSAKTAMVKRRPVSLRGTLSRSQPGDHDAWNR